MIISNIRKYYQKAVMRTYTLAGIVFYLIFGTRAFFSIQFYKYSQSPILFTIGAIYFFLCHKYFIPYAFYRGLKCPKCDQRYADYGFGKIVRIDLLNQTSCQYCKYQGNFEM